jgi:CBS domain-containing protein
MVRNGTLQWERLFLQVSKLMAGDLQTVEDAARLMLKHKIGGLPIVLDGKLVGIVTTSDLLRAFLLVVEGTSRIMNP